MSAGVVMPTKGCARRRAKAVARRQYVYDMDVRSAYRLDRFPRYAVAAGGCSCGWKQWLMPGADDADYEAYYQASAAHDAMCGDLS